MNDISPAQVTAPGRKLGDARVSRPLRILHVTSGLGLGGAETVLYRLATYPSTNQHEVVCLGPRDWYSSRLEQAGVRVHHVPFSSVLSALRESLPLERIVKSSEADLVQCWMYRGNAVGGLFGRIARKPVVWNIRASTLGPLRPASRILARVTGQFARWVPDRVINCSAHSAELHARWGYGAVEGQVIPNGYDPTLFFPDDESRAKVRKSLGVASGEFLIATIGRWHAQKGFPHLLHALRFLRDRQIPVRLLMIGRGLDPQNSSLQALIAECGCTDVVELLGERADMPDLARAPDLHVLASIGVEGFPNVVAETLLSGTPNVVTEIGDSATIVGDKGWVVPPGDAQKLADAIADAHAEWASSGERWQKRRDAGRERIVKTYSLRKMVEAYEQMWRQVIGKVRVSGHADKPMVAGDMARQSRESQPLPNIDPKTVAGFGREWDRFDQSKLVGEEYDDMFEGYFGLFPFNDLGPGSEGFDLGCGSGRWAAGIAPRVGKLHCIDPAKKALDVARRRLAGRDNVEFHLASADSIPLEDGTQDFGYSLGVLHHIPDTARALADAVRKLKPGAPFLLYIYYKLENRPAWFRWMWRGADLVRRVTCRLPFPVLRGVTSVIAGAVYLPLARGSRIAEKAGIDPSNIPLSGYRNCSFYTMRTDALDRFGTRLEQRFSRPEIERMMYDAGLTNVRFSDRMPFWVAIGTRKR
jgi:glycosyltransferase involved in cell wall biosynthesis/SAM-dependent methyltransferase